jgi:hypothetical protein
MLHSQWNSASNSNSHSESVCRTAYARRRFAHMGNHISMRAKASRWPHRRWFADVGNHRSMRAESEPLAPPQVVCRCGKPQIYASESEPLAPPQVVCRCGKPQIYASESEPLAPPQVVCRCGKPQIYASGKRAAGPTAGGLQMWETINLCERKASRWPHRRWFADVGNHKFMRAESEPLAPPQAVCTYGKPQIYASGKRAAGPTAGGLQIITIPRRTIKA